jgi:hypothetical protein
MKDFKEVLLRGKCLSEIQVPARRCAFCTTEVGAATA